MNHNKDFDPQKIDRFSRKPSLEQKIKTERESQPKKDPDHEIMKEDFALPLINGKRVNYLSKITNNKQEHNKENDLISYADLKNHIEKKIKKQPCAIAQICNVYCAHQAFLRGDYFKKIRVLLHGPSGCGKTAIVSEVSQKTKIPFFSIDASSLTGAGYKGVNLRDAIRFIINECKEKSFDPNKIVIFFDEIDKLFLKNIKNDNNVNAVISELLVFMEKGLAELNFSTEKSLIFFAGAFSQVSLMEAKNFSKEFFGRITNIVEIKKLTYLDLKTILETSTDSPFVVMCKLFKNKNRKFEMSPEAIECISRLAEKSGTGARAIESIMHVLLQPYFGEKEGVGDVFIQEQDVLSACSHFADLTDRFNHHSLSLSLENSLALNEGELI